MTISRKSLADAYAEHDAIIEAAQTAKREATLAYRGQLDALGMDKDNIKAEIEGFKLAYRRKVAIEKKGEDVVEHRDAIADEIFLEITTSNAPRATRAREIIEEFDAETGEILTSSRAEAGVILSAESDGFQTSSAGTEGEADRQPIPGPHAPAQLSGRTRLPRDASGAAGVSVSANHSEPAEGFPTPTSAVAGDESAVIPSAALVVAPVHGSAA